MRNELRDQIAKEAAIKVSKECVTGGSGDPDGPSGKGPGVTLWMEFNTNEAEKIFSAALDKYAGGPRAACQRILDGYDNPDRDGDFDWPDAAEQLRLALQGGEVE